MNSLIQCKTPVAPLSLFYCLQNNRPMINFSYCIREKSTSYWKKCIFFLKDKWDSGVVEIIYIYICKYSTYSGLLAESIWVDLLQGWSGRITLHHCPGRSDMRLQWELPTDCNFCTAIRTGEIICGTWPYTRPDSKNH